MDFDGRFPYDSHSPHENPLPERLVQEANDAAPKSLYMVEPKALSEEFQREVVRRGARNEATFQHLETAFTLLTQPRQALVQQAPRQALPHHPYPRTRYEELSSQRLHANGRCGELCACRCHTQATNRIRLYQLTAFSTTFGTFSFFFNGNLSQKCTLPTCKSRQTRLFRVHYTLPTWLLQAAISATYSDLSGTPELTLRVLRRLPTDPTTMFHSLIGLAYRGDLTGMHTALRSRTSTVHDARGDDGTGVLQFALRNRQYAAAELLLREGADPFQFNDKGEAPFQLAVRHIYTSTMAPTDRARMLAALPMDEVVDAVELSDLHRVVMGIWPLDVGAYLARHAVVDVNEKDLFGWSALYYAAGRGDVQAVRALLSAGASPQRLVIPGKPDGESPLSMACAAGHLAVVRVLLDAGAAVEPPCLISVARAHAEEEVLVAIARALLAAGARWDTRLVGVPFNALLMAGVSDRVGLFELLVEEAGADCNWVDAEGSSLLQNLVVYGSQKVAAWMIQKKELDWEHVGEGGQTVLHMLGLVADEAMMRVFIRAEVRPELERALRDESGRTATECFEGREGVSRELRGVWDELLRVLCEEEEEEEDGDKFFDAVGNFG